MATRSGLTALILTAHLLTFVGKVEAATFTVTKTADTVDGSCDADCSLREALTAANSSAGADTINFSTTGTITLGSSLPTITESVTISGPGVTDLTVNANGTGRCFLVDSPANNQTVSISGLTVTGGNTSGAGASGAGIRVLTGDTLNLTSAVITGNTVAGAGNSGGGISATSATLVITDSTISGNSAASGGGISHTISGNLTITKSTISGNTATDGGIAGGLRLQNSDIVTITNSTISGNMAEGHGGGIDYSADSPSDRLFLNNVTMSGNVADFDGSGGRDGGGIRHGVGSGGEVHLRNTIIAGNTNSGGGPPDCLFTTSDVSHGYNLIGDNTGCTNLTLTTGDQGGTGTSPLDPKLGSLASNGGATQTRLLQSGSPAIDAGNQAGCTDDNGTSLTTDQRGFTRPADGNGDGTSICDIGAVEIACGNGIVEGSEACDDGNSDNTDSCSNTCVSATCGDGFVRAGVEGCDDGNTSNTDACLNTCVSATCGDGTVQADVEQCDNGSSNSDTTVDACRTTCVNPSCGDEVLDTGENCDDGNTTDGDGCSATCAVEAAPAPAASTRGTGGGCSLIRAS